MPISASSLTSLQDCCYLALLELHQVHLESEPPQRAEHTGNQHVHITPRKAVLYRLQCVHEAEINTPDTFQDFL